MRNQGTMILSRLHLCGLLTLAVALGGCDSGKDGKAAPAKKAASANAGPQKAGADAKAKPAGGDAKVEAVAKPAVAGTPTAAPPADTPPTEVAAPEVPPTEEPPAEVAPEEPAADDPTAAAEAADPEADKPADAPAAVAAGGAEVNGIALTGDAELLRLVLAHDVENRQPVDPAVSFPAGQKVSIFIEARNGEEEQFVQVTWETVKTGRRTSPVSVKIPHRKLHRTRAYKTLKRAGEYRCIVLDSAGEELAAIPFTIEEA